MREKIEFLDNCFDIAERARAQKIKAEPPICHFCKAMTGYLKVPHSYPGVGFVLNVSGLPFFSFENFYYLIVNRCARCAGKYDGKCFGLLPSQFQKKRLSTVRNKLSESEWLDYSNRYNEGKEEKIKEYEDKKPKSRSNADRAMSYIESFGGHE